MFQTKAIQNIKTQVTFSVFLRKSCCLSFNVEKQSRAKTDHR